MTRDEELDAMDTAGKKSDIISQITSHGAIRLTSKPAMAFWGDAVSELENEGLVTTEFIEEYAQQYSYLIVRMTQ